MTPVLIPIINGRELSRACIKSVLAQDVPCEVFVLDNGATDGSGEMLRAWADDRIHYIAARKPSVAASWNFGLKWLFAHGHDAVLVLNNDTLLRPDTVRWLVADGGPFVTAVGTVDKEKIAPHIFFQMNGGTFTKGQEFEIKEYERHYAPPDPAMKRPFPDYSCYLIRRECWDIVGPFDENFLGAFCEDLDHHIRIHKAGMTAMCLELPFYHVGSATINTADEPVRKEISAQAQKNREYFKQKWGVEVGSSEYYQIFGTGSPQ